MNSEHEVLDLFMRQPFFQLLTRLDSDKANTSDCTSADELALFLQNTSLSLQSGWWDTEKIFELTEAVCGVLKSIRPRERACLAQSVLLSVLNVIKAGNAKMSPDTRLAFLDCLKSFADVDANAQPPAPPSVRLLPDTDPLLALPADPFALQKVTVLPLPDASRTENDAPIHGWVHDGAQDSWAAECVVHVLLRDAVALGRGSVLTHDGVFVALSLPKTQIRDAELFVY
jgi:hypothetical protein